MWEAEVYLIRCRVGVMERGGCWISKPGVGDVSPVEREGEIGGKVWKAS